MVLNIIQILVQCYTNSRWLKGTLSIRPILFILFFWTLSELFNEGEKIAKENIDKSWYAIYLDNFKSVRAESQPCCFSPVHLIKGQNIFRDSCLFTDS